MSRTILFFAPGVDRGGVATAFCKLAPQLESMGWVVKVMLHYKLDYESAAIPKRYIVGWMRKAPIRNVKLLRLLNLFNVLTRWRFFFLGVPRVDHDLFVVYQMHGFCYWRRYTKKPVLGWLHGLPPVKNLSFNGRIWTRVSHDEMERFSRLIGVSKEVAAFWQARYGLAREPLVVENPVDVDEQLQKGDEPQTEIQNSSRPQFIVLGRISPEKGVLRLLKIVQRLLTEGFVFDLNIVGSGPEEERCRKYIQDHKVDHVRFWGMKVNPYPYLRACELLILPSYSEGLPMVIREALLQKCAVLATDVGGCRSALNEGKWGRLVSSNEEAIYAGLRDYLRNINRCRPEGGFARVESEIRQRNDRQRSLVAELFKDVSQSGMVKWYN